jgi:hypothetical protein
LSPCTRRPFTTTKTWSPGAGKGSSVNDVTQLFVSCHAFMY